jgi:hypothetical protein
VKPGRFGLGPAFLRRRPARREETCMRKILALLVLALAVGACREETPAEKVERKVRNAADELK